MPPKRLQKSQNEWFYDNNWTIKMDGMVIDEIESLKAASVWDVGGENEEAGLWMQECMNALIGIYHTAAFYNSKISFLRERFMVFDAIRKRAGVFWNEETNVVQSVSGTFDSLVEEFGKLWILAYENVGESLFRRLKDLFEQQLPNRPKTEYETDMEDLNNSVDLLDG